eukprot:TRINITY_DN9640_c0_g1_i3.p1 TRINITY_DN9640_c0_g1~~TRINITY_DN9640_c0_g1_i3.p1  ORF type:complete len:241 (-),score=44.34 TRINITY_DN9640_c0_g1_i3:289-1011(-)
MADASIPRRSLSASHIPIQEMYKISARINTVWGIEGYDAPRKYGVIKFAKYMDTSKQTPKATNIPGFLDYITKMHKSTPAPNAYNTRPKWIPNEGDPKAKPPPVPKATKKLTFIDEIFENAKKKGFTTPGPGAYMETEKLDKKRARSAEKAGGTSKTSKSERVNFLCEYEHLSSAVPGPGNYNPRLFVAHQAQTSSEHHQTRGFHKETQRSDFEGEREKKNREERRSWIVQSDPSEFRHI